MKQSVLMIFSFFLLAACSAYQGIPIHEQKGLKTMSLFQTHQAIPLKEKERFNNFPGLKIKTGYRYEEKAGERPLVTLDINIEKLGGMLPDSTVFISLEGENIPLFALQGKYVIPENLWVSIVHCQNIQYKLNTGPDLITFRLDEKQGNQLTAFFDKAIKLRDVIFPAVPRGKKKW